MPVPVLDDDVFVAPMAHGGARETERGCNRRSEQRSCVLLVVEILKFGFHLRHEGTESEFASYNMGEASQQALCRQRCEFRTNSAGQNL